MIMPTSSKNKVDEKRIIAKFKPQAWIKNHTVVVDAQGPLEWDATEFILEMGYEKFSKLCDRNYPSDDLARIESAPQWVRDWSGPFEVDVMVSIGRYFGSYDPDLITLGEQIPRKQYEIAAASFAKAKESGLWRAMTPDEILQASMTDKETSRLSVKP